MESYKPSPEEIQKAEEMMPEELKAERVVENERYDREVNDILVGLYEQYGGDKFDLLLPDIQDEWYLLEMEAQTAPSEEAKAKLRNFLDTLDGESSGYKA
jgi:hypothetical protein